MAGAKTSSDEENKQKLLKIITDLYALHKTREALHFCNQLLEHFPADYDVMMKKALVLIKQNNIEEARPIVDYLNKKRPQESQPKVVLGYLYEIQGEIKKANQAFLRALAVDPKNADARFHHVLTFERMNKLDEAEKSLEQGVKDHGDHPGLLYMGALIKRRAKKYDEAVELLNKIPDDIKSEYVSNKHFELTQNYDRLKRYDEAFEALEIAQEERLKFAERQGYTDESAAYRTVVQQSLAYVSASPPVNDAVLDDTGANLCFFVGFPRSGTTLAQQMMQAHPDIETVEEKLVLSDVRMQIMSDHSGDMSVLSRLTPAQIRTYQLQYRKGMAHYTTTDNYKMLVDKMPLTLTYIPVVKTLFPQAKILVALRHPCDCLLSCMMQNFDFNAAMMNLTNLKDGANLYDAVFSIYEKSKEVWPGGYHEYRYEDIIVNTQDELQKICEFLGVQWDQDMLGYRDKIVKRQDVIRTPSFRQVVEPLHTKAKYRWKNYSRYFEEVMPLLEPHIKRYDY